jgi:hypothetical protein
MRRTATKPATPPAPELLKARFKLVPEKETKGAFRYAEIDQDGNRLYIEDSDAVIGYMYFRKAALLKWSGTDTAPDLLELNVVQV